MIKKLWRRIWKFFFPPKIETQKRSVDIVGGNCKVRLSRGWVQAMLVKKNIKTCWVRLWDGNVIKRRYGKVVL